MKITVEVNGKPVEIELTQDQVAKVKNQKITDRIKTFADVLQALPEKRRDKWAAACANLDNQGIANEKVKLISEVLNEGVEMDAFNQSQIKYYPWFEVKGNAFVFGDFNFWHSSSCVGSRLCFKSAELATYAGKQFIGIYQDLLK